MQEAPSLLTLYKYKQVFDFIKYRSLNNEFKLHDDALLKAAREGLDYIVELLLINNAL